MKKENKFDYSKKYPNNSWDDECLFDYQFWGLHPKHGRMHVDTKRFKKICKWMNADEFLYDGMFKNRTTTYLILEKKHKYDYKINIYRDFINCLRKDWNNEYKPIFSIIKTPKQVRDEYRLNEMMFTSNVDDLDEIDINAMLKGVRRENKYGQIIQSLYCQFVSKICVEIERAILAVSVDLGYKKKDFDFDEFITFSDGLRHKKDEFLMEHFEHYKCFHELRLINNFLKHNTISTYRKLKNNYPNRVYPIRNEKNDKQYENGMFAGNWVHFEKDYIDKLFDKLINFLKNIAMNI